MKKIVSIFLVGALSVAFALAHEFWLHPSAWFVQPGQPVQVRLRVGENFAGEAWEAGPSRVVRFFSLLKKKETARLESLRKNGLDSLWLTFEKPGTQLVALATNSKYLELEAEKFDAYLQEDGLEHVRELRRQNGQTDKPGRELYRREAATLIQVGDKPTKVFFEKTGFDLSIRPEKNPLSARSSDSLNFQIFYLQKPLANALVRHWHKDAGGKAAVQFQKSDAKGQVRFLLHPGEQMVSVVHMVQHAVPAEADWQSVWGNLTFCLR